MTNRIASKPPEKVNGNQVATHDTYPDEALIAEKAVLGCIILVPSVFPEIRKLLPKATCFYDDAHREIYRRFLALNDAGKPADVSHLGDLERCGGAAYVSSLSRLGPSEPAYSFASYADELKEYWEIRELQEKCVNIHQAIANRRPLEEIRAIAADLLTPRHAPGIRCWSPKLLTSSEFQAGDFRQEYLVNKALVRGLPFIIGGQSKTLKTSLLIDLLISIGSIGQSFFNYFPVCRPGRCLILSGESGEFTLQETFRRQCRAKGIDPSEVNVVWGFTLPSVSNQLDMATLRKVILDNGITTAMIDPAYISLLAGASGQIQSSNVMQMGPLLGEYSAVGVETGCTVGLCHHTTKRIERPGEAPALEDLSMSGFAEWARQWLLVGRRKPYEEGTGLHQLWLRIGGSAGHSGLYAVDIDEGELQDDFTGRKWDVTVTTAKDARSQESQRRDAEKGQREQEKISAAMDAVMLFLNSRPDGETASIIRDSAGLKTAACDAAIAQLLRQGAIEKCGIHKSNRTNPYPGFRRTRDKD